MAVVIYDLGHYEHMQPFLVALVMQMRILFELHRSKVPLVQTRETVVGKVRWAEVH